MPVSGLLRAEQALADVLREMAAQRGCGILYVSHRVDEVRSLVDRILVMRDGRIVRGHSPREASTGDVVYSMFERRLSAPQRPGEAARHTAGADRRLPEDPLRREPRLLHVLGPRLHRRRSRGRPTCWQYQRHRSRLSRCSLAWCSAHLSCWSASTHQRWRRPGLN